MKDKDLFSYFKIFQNYSIFPYLFKELAEVAMVRN